MEYTLEQKALAAIRGDLWWRIPEGQTEDERKWSLLCDDISCLPELNDLQKPGFVYHIGPKAPPILSDLEAELLECLSYLVENCDDGGMQKFVSKHMRDVIKKARGEA
jgi:hypothetical protein